MILSFETPECSPNEKNLEIIINKQNIIGWINFKFEYHSHGIIFFQRRRADKAIFSPPFKSIYFYQVRIREGP